MSNSGVDFVKYGTELSFYVILQTRRKENA